MYIPRKVIAGLIACVLLMFGWAVAVANDRNPLPFPDRNYQVFTASSIGGLRAMEEVMREHGIRPRFRVDTDQVDRTIFSDGTIINHVHPQLLERLGRPAGAIGLVADDPVAAAAAAAALLRSRGFEAEVIENAEPGMPIAFVTTDALSGAVLVFRRHQLRMGSRPARCQSWKRSYMAGISSRV